MGAMHGRAAPALLLALLGLAAGAVRAEDESAPRPFDCPIRALLTEEDAGLLRAYDGIRRGLEQARLPRVCLERRPEGGAGAAADEPLRRLAAAPPPLLFVLGREAARWLEPLVVDGSLRGVPRVYVDAGWTDGATAWPPEPEVPPPAGVVRGLLGVQRAREILGAAFPGGEAGPFWLSRPGENAAGLARALGVATGAASPRAILDLACGEARRPREEWPPLPVVSDDLQFWRRGAFLLVLPDHELLGRVAADVGRRLLLDPHGGVLRRTVGGMEVRVDLRAASEAGIDLPLPFLAGADVLRHGPRASPEGER
jgi:hypothetical protein